MRYTLLGRISATTLLLSFFAAPHGTGISGQTLPPQQADVLGLNLAQSAAIADFNADGISDVAVADFLNDVIVVMARDVDGRLAPVASLASGRGPRSIIAKDFNGDGALDIAVANFLSGDLQVFPGGSRGQFGDPQTLHFDPGIASLNGDDVDGDRDVDLIVANFLSGEITLLAAAGSGTFERRTIGVLPGMSLVVQRDVNGDGTNDVLAVNGAGNNVRLFAGLGNGAFEDAGSVDAEVAFPEEADVPGGDGLTVRAILGDGQAARGGSAFPDPLVFEVSSDGDPIPGSAITLSTVIGGDDRIEDSRWTNEDGQAALRVVAARAPQSQLIAAAVPGANVAVAGELSALTHGAFRSALRESVSRIPESIDPETQTRLDAALEGLAANDETQAVTSLMRAIGGENDAPSNLVRRAINQILLIGIQAPGPDLVETAISEPPAFATLKDKFTVTDTAQNQGTTTAGMSNTRYYLSIDGVLKTKRLKGGGRTVPSLDAGASSQGSDLVTIAISTKPGSYFLLACADDRKVVLEDNEGNNCISSTGQIQVKAPDLIVTAISEPPASAQQGSTFSVSDTTKNNGDFSAGQSTTEYYLSLDNKKTNGDFLVASRSVPALAAGAISADTATATVNASPNASYFLLACADAKKKVAEGNANNTAETNNCRTSIGKVAVTPSAPDGGPLTNGALVTGRISVAEEVDEWTFSANAGDRIAVHIGEIVDNNDFRPWLRLLAPNDTVLANVSGVAATVIDDIVAPATGSYRVRVASFDSGFDGTGTYRLTMTHTPGPITVSPGDQGGPLTNGAIHEGEIIQGDVDVWTFTANAGERLSIHIGEITDTDDFRPWLRLWAPNGATLGDTSGVLATVIDDVVAPVTGTYLVLVASFDSGFDGEGTYRMTLTKTPGPITVSPGDQGGPLTNGAIHEGEIIQGDVDVWTFTATAGDRIALHIGEITDTDDFRPWIRLWAPNGATLGDTSGVFATVMDDVVAPVTGTYLVLVATFDSGFDGEGTYRLTMTHTPGPITVSPGDQGGPLTNGGTHNGEIVRGDVDVWTINVTAGQHITVNINEVVDNDDYRPWIRLWAPNGATLGDVSGLTSAQINGAVAPATGTYLVLVATFDSGFDGTGTYSLVVNVTP